MVNTCFKQKSNLLKCIVFLVSILIVILVALAIILVRRKGEKFCNSEYCLQINAEVIQYVDKSQNPCDDFYSFSCAKYAKNRREFPPAEPENELNWLITEPVEFNDTKPLIMQKLFYHSCNNLSAFEMDNDETILDIFYNMGEWPIVKGVSWNGTYFDWTNVVQASRNLGLKIDWFLDFSIVKDVNDTGTNILKIDVPKSLRPLTSNEKYLKKQLLTEVAILMGASTKLAHYQTAQVVQFEDSLGIIAERHRGRHGNQIYDNLPKLSINEVQTFSPSIKWLEIINSITGNRMVGSDWIIFNIREYVEELNFKILGTAKRFVADYMLWKIVEEIWPFLSSRVREKFEKYNNKTVYNWEPETDRQKFCVNESKKLFPLVAESVYIRRHVTEQKRQLVREMVVIIQNKFIKLLDHAFSIRREYKHIALAKLQALKFMIGGPDELFDQFGFAEKIGLYGFGFTSVNVIDMLTARKRRFYDKYYAVLNRRIENNTADYYEKIVNITKFVVVNNNTIIIPAAILKDTFYNPNLPNYFNFGTLGKSIAHEIFNHIFNQRFSEEEIEDSEGGMFYDIFEQATKCLVKESLPFHISEIRRPRRMREFLAHFVSAEIAYEAYKEWLLMHPDEVSRAVEHHTPEQLFWIHTSKSSCTKIYPKHNKDISRFKIIAPLKNSQNFARDYQCPEGSRMNPRNRCSVL